jgi:hypothetical protein
MNASMPPAPCFFRKRLSRTAITRKPGLSGLNVVYFPDIDQCSLLTRFGQVSTEGTCHRPARIRPHQHIVPS